MSKPEHTDFIPTASGLHFDYHDIMRNEVKIEDIAHALSHLCRFGGHVLRFYSVAQHSVIVSHLVPPEHALGALLHDATEAFVQDVVRPVKRHCADYKAIEEMVAELIDKTFDVWTEHPAIKRADNMALYAEGVSFFGSVDGWGLDEYAWEHAKIRPDSIDMSRVLFLKRYEELTSVRQREG